MYICVQWAVSVTVSHFHHANIPHKFLLRAKCIGVCQSFRLWSDCLFSWCISHRASLVYDQTIVCAVGAIDVAACPLSVTKDIWSHWWEDMTKKMKNTNTIKFEMTMAACPVVSTKDSVITPIIKFQFHWVKKNIKHITAVNDGFGRVAKYM